MIYKLTCVKFSNNSLETLMQNVVSLTCFLVKLLIKKNCHNSRKSNDIDRKLGPLSKLEKKGLTICNVDKLCHCHFFNLRLIGTNPEARFRMHGP